MKRYDPSQPPDPAKWLALDEQVRIDLAEEYHRRARIALPNAKVHAVLHVIVENQLASSLEPVVRAVARLTADGLSRHDAVHAVASVLAEHMYDLFSADADPSDAQARYNAAVGRLTARAWRRG